jgi:putative hemolysin
MSMMYAPEAPLGPLMTQFLLLPLLILLNAFFVAAEYALVALRSSQVQTMRQQGYVFTARAMEQMRAQMPNALGTIQICITLVNLLIGWTVEPAMTALLTRLLGGIDLGLHPTTWQFISTSTGFIVVTLVTVVVSELVPKALTLQHTEIVARLTAQPMVQIQRLIFPLVWLMSMLASATTRLLGLGAVEIEGRPMSAEEIHAIATESGQAGSLTPREQSLILNTLTLGKRSAHEIMVPRVRVTYLDLKRTMEENFQTIEEHLFSRFPLCNGGMDHVIGVVYTKEFLVAHEAEPNTESTVLSLIARPAFFVPVTVSLDRLLTTFHERRTHMVLLVDEHGGIDGLVSVTDVMDELVGEIHEG